jgi:hypothetical protein
MKTKYRYLYCAEGVMYWEAVLPIPGDSRTEQVWCGWDWFWGTAK